MKAITIYQPWASLIAQTVETVGGQEIKAKRFETRSRSVNYRGQIAIHSGIKKPSDIMSVYGYGTVYAMGCAFGITEKRAEAIIKHLDELPRGKIIAVGELTGCFRIIEGFAATVLPRKRFPATLSLLTLITSKEEILFGDWTPGRFAWEMANVKKLENPVPAKGKQGLWNWDEQEAI
jgi:hypothetical protein